MHSKKLQLIFEIGAKIIVHLLLIMAAIVFIFPFYWMVSNSVKTADIILKFPPVLIPPVEKITISGYIDIFTIFPFSRWLFNSAIVSISCLLLALLINCTAAYAFARLNFPARDIIFFILLSTLFIPFQIVMIPAFVIINYFGWIDTYRSLIIPWLPNAFSIFFLRQYFLTIPTDYEEAAIIDGASRIKIFYKIILPLSKPALVTIGLFTFMWSWDDFLWPLIVIRSQEMYVIQLGIQSFFGIHLNAWHMIMVGASLAVLPTYVLFLIFQKYYVGGIAMSGLKG